MELSKKDESAVKRGNNRSNQKQFLKSFCVMKREVIALTDPCSVLFGKAGMVPTDEIIIGA